MTTATTLLNSDCLRFDSLSFTLTGPSQIPSGPRTTGAICIRKPVGGLDFVLSTKTDLQIDLPVDIKAPFKGRFVGQTPQGDTLVQWDVDQMLNVGFSVAGLNIDVNRVRGSILCQARLVIPRESSTSCDGLPRSLGVQLDTVVGNQLGVDASIAGHDLLVLASDVAFTAKAGDDFTISAKIKPLLDECGIGAPQGNIQTFFVLVQDTGGEPVTYAWDASGGTIQGPRNAYSVHVMLDDATVDVSVTLTIAGVSETLTFKYRAETELTNQFKRWRCQFTKYLSPNFRLNPIWDPLRDDLTEPQLIDGVRRMAVAAEKLAREARDLLKKIER